MEHDKSSPLFSQNNNNDKGSSDEGDGHISISCEERSALFSEELDHRGSSGPWSASKVRLVWKDVCYTVQTLDWKFPSLKFPVRSSKQILNRNSGSMESEKLTACIGPSGAGKSSLLEILAGRREKGVTGSISIHYDSKSHASSTKIAFMGQKDVFCGTLTVRETLMFASRLKNCSLPTRIPKKLTLGQSSHLKLNDVTIAPMQEYADVRNFHADLVADIMDELSLTGCAHVYVSSCSGGQQKRLSIACELLSRPDILLLDEPTSGLGQLLCPFVPPACVCVSIDQLTSPFCRTACRLLLRLPMHSLAQEVDSNQVTGCHPKHPPAKLADVEPI